MNLESRINYISFLIIGIIFIIVGAALNELETIETAINWSVSTGDNLDQWYEFLKPWIGDEKNGLPGPWQP